jgi:alpha-tubulin suppressor-like RCC1 family protein
VKGLATFVACLLAASCAKTNPYKCSDDSQCVRNGMAGVCAPEGFCAFADPACPSGERFEPNAGDSLGGQCTAPPDAPVPPCGHLGEACCTGGEQGSAACLGATYCNAGMCDECVADISFGHDQGCYLKKDHTVWCAGRDANGEVGNGSNSTTLVTTAVQVKDSTGPITDATAIGNGYAWGCVVRTGGAVACWGRNYDGQLGTNNTNNSNVAAPVLMAMGSATAPLTGIADVASGGATTCGRDTTGVVYCWGYGGQGALGDGTTTTTRLVAAPVLAGSAAFTGAENIKAGDGHFCVKKGTETWCWGANSDYQLATGSNAAVTNPVKTATATEVGLGNYHTCWVNADTTISCVGVNYHATMGNGSGNDYQGPDQQMPGPVITEAGPPFMGAAQVVAGGAMTCARTTDGHVWCWGDNKYGQVGGGSPTPVPTPVLDTATGKPLEHADRLVAKYAHVCAHTTDEGWKCWGRGSQGEFGDGKQRSHGLATPLGVSCP